MCQLRWCAISKSAESRGCKGDAAFIMEYDSQNLSHIYYGVWFSNTQGTIKHCNNCYPVSLLIVRSQRSSRIQVLNCTLQWQRLCVRSHDMNQTYETREFSETSDPSKTSNPAKSTEKSCENTLYMQRRASVPVQRVFSKGSVWLAWRKSFPVGLDLPLETSLPKQTL